MHRHDKTKYPIHLTDTVLPAIGCIILQTSAPWTTTSRSLLFGSQSFGLLCDTFFFDKGLDFFADFRLATSDGRGLSNHDAVLVTDANLDRMILFQLLNAGTTSANDSWSSVLGNNNGILDFAFFHEAAIFHGLLDHLEGFLDSSRDTRDLDLAFLVINVDESTSLVLNGANGGSTLSVNGSDLIKGSGSRLWNVEGDSSAVIEPGSDHILSLFNGSSGSRDLEGGGVLGNVQLGTSRIILELSDLLVVLAQDDHNITPILEIHDGLIFSKDSVTTHCCGLLYLLVGSTSNDNLAFINVGIELASSGSLDLLNVGSSLTDNGLDSFRRLDILATQSNAKGRLGLVCRKKLIDHLLGSSNGSFGTGDLKNRQINVETSSRSSGNVLDGGSLGSDKDGLVIAIKLNDLSAFGIRISDSSGSIVVVAVIAVMLIDNDPASFVLFVLLSFSGCSLFLLFLFLLLLSLG
mmetsp:Transcript_36040/g.87103  ORF Transcript_36040/g.87103 Transcript_36040/m.87103 type:complete len:464 (-) Transcript_36040:185-1576(-)